MKRLLTTCVASAALIGASLSILAAQEQAPGTAPAAQGQGGGRGGRAGGGGGGRGGGRGRAPSAVRSIPAETTAAKVKDPSWQAPRTPWGHPDIQGTFSTDDMRGVPQERNPNQADRVSLTPDEFLQRASSDEASRFGAVNQETFLRNEFGIRTFGYTSIVIEPANGRRPRADGEGAGAAEGAGRRWHLRTRPLNGFDDFSLYDRCITAGISSITPVLYGNGVRFAQSPNEVVVTYEMIHDSRVIYLDNRPHVRSKVKQWLGDSRGRWEGTRWSSRRPNFDERGPAIGGVPAERDDEADRVVYARRPADDRIQVPRRRSRDGDRAVHDALHADDAAGLSRGLRVQLPRRGTRRSSTGSAASACTTRRRRNSARGVCRCLRVRRAWKSTARRIAACRFVM
jgi:hypothetical protein